MHYFVLVCVCHFFASWKSVNGTLSSLLRFYEMYQKLGPSQIYMTVYSGDHGMTILAEMKCCIRLARTRKVLLHRQCISCDPLSKALNSFLRLVSYRQSLKDG